MYSPIFESVSSNYKEIKFVKCNIDEGKRVAVRFGVRSIPTTIIIKDKEVTSSMSGFMTEEQLKNFVSSNIKRRRIKMEIILQNPMIMFLIGLVTTCVIVYFIMPANMILKRKKSIVF